MVRPNSPASGNSTRRLRGRMLALGAGLLALGSCLDRQAALPTQAERTPAAAASPARAASPTASPTISFGNFSSTSGLTLVGDAARSGEMLRLTAAQPDKAGAVWYTQQKQVVQTGFTTKFTFRITGRAGDFCDDNPEGATPCPKGADGLAFLIQSHAPDALGELGGGIGYHGIPRSLAVEIDTWRNPGLLDPDRHHISVHTNGAGPNSAHHAFSRGQSAGLTALENDLTHTLVVRFEPPGTLRVYLDVLSAPVLTISELDLSGVVDEEGRAWVGFTAATGRSWENHDLLAWEFTPTGAPGSLSGVVRDAHTHAPIQGAQVRILNTTHLATTDTSGAYSFASVAPGTYEVRVEKPGYQPVTRSDVVITSGQSTTADFAIMRIPGQVAGKVTEATTQTVLAGATVTLEETGQTATTDTSGAYSIPGVAAGTYTVTASKAGFHPGSQPNVTVTGGQTTQVDFALQRQTGTLAGRITDARTGGGLQGAVVTVVQTGRFGGTDGSGSYSLSGIPTGTYTVEVTRPNYASTSRSGVVIASDATTPLNVSLQPLPHTINVNVTGSPGVAGIGVTARSVQTEEIFVACTDPTGTARLSVPPGGYLVHARNLPICNSLDVTEWPHPNEGASFNTSATETANHVGVLFQTSDGGSATLNPSNYRSAVQSPLGLGPGGESSLQLRFQTGATIQCTLLDQNGEPFTLAQKEHFYGVLPFGSGSGLPPSLNPRGLPPGIANVLATLQPGARSDECRVRGVPAGFFVLETNRVLVNGEVVTYREGVTVTEAEAASGATVEVTGEPEPLRASTGYLLEPMGDSPSSTDIGLLTYGWGVAGSQVSNDFVLAADFVGLGEYVLELITVQGQRIEASAVCEAKRCKLLPSTPKVARDIVRVSGTGTMRRGVAKGTVIWTVALPGVASVQFRVTTGQRNRLDAAPNAGYLSAVRPARPDGGNSWAVDY